MVVAVGTGLGPQREEVLRGELQLRDHATEDLPLPGAKLDEDFQLLVAVQHPQRGGLVVRSIAILACALKRRLPLVVGTFTPCRLPTVAFEVLNLQMKTKKKLNFHNKLLVVAEGGWIHTVPHFFRTGGKKFEG